MPELYDQATDFKKQFETERQRRIKVEHDIEEVRRDARTDKMLIGAQNSAAKM